jgi:hypothetical protein
MSDAARADVEMKGGGYYSLATRGAKEVIDRATPLVLQAIDRMKRSSRPFVMSDMGCADGGTSLDLVRTCIDHLAPREFTIVYTDQPRNDFNALFRIVYGGTGLPSYLVGRDWVRVLVSATSFYRQVLPSTTVDLAFSATAMQWMSAKPVNVTGAVHSVFATGAEHEAFAAQARTDWHDILRHRTAELVSGGRFVSVTFGIDERGRFLGNTGGVSMHETFEAIWEELADEGVITPAELLDMTLPQYYRTVDEFRAPFDDGSVPKLALEDVFTRVVECPFAAAYTEHHDAARFAREYVPTLRSWTEGTFRDALSERRSPEERAAIIDEYYGRYERRVREAPEGHGMSYVHVYLVARRA